MQSLVPTSRRTSQQQVREREREREREGECDVGLSLHPYVMAPSPDTAGKGTDSREDTILAGANRMEPNGFGVGARGMSMYDRKQMMRVGEQETNTSCNV
ncbi:hypothetical protein SCP_0410270 [Sparassis crispa]|uniref:Uncharacterized protein n=1 Tax=Sparassis crispa TaxID=139825 RepID=A0A401GKG4_9APHY|nr:hypothetical protein SCP_0410270 [Sparassis crispa]GBE82642.1 hypothetical protein SCP_0410270 [Sparassis crispa]